MNELYTRIAYLARGNLRIPQKNNIGTNGGRDAQIDLGESHRYNERDATAFHITEF